MLGRSHALSIACSRDAQRVPITGNTATIEGNTQCNIPNQTAPSAAPRNQMASLNCAGIHLVELRQWRVDYRMTARCISYQTRHRSPRLAALRALLASHKQRDTRQTKLPSLCAGLFHARYQTRTIVSVCRYPVVFKRFYRVGSGRDPSTPCDKSGQSLDLH